MNRYSVLFILIQLFVRADDSVEQEFIKLFNRVYTTYLKSTSLTISQYFSLGSYITIVHT